MTDEFPNLMKTATLTPENLLKYAAYSRKKRVHESFSTLRMDLGTYLLHYASHSGNLPTADDDDSQEEWMSNARLFYSEDAQPLPLEFEEAPTDLCPWLSNHLGLVDFMVDAHSTLGMPLIRRYGAAAYDYVGQLSGEVETLVRDEAAKQIVIQAVEYAVRRISTKCNGVVAKMEPYMEELKSAIKNLVEEQTDEEDMMEED
ncbi:hypothetical protein J4E93_009155 [Alternaria ventricosa]|uniref:uncharacterized protein n=1 Tax=Alternaria ventricosa TaxID=1187951 RepID=UPI0020C27AF0|nr:uncharacterized protein J4E93_009155 [Alternaria ventricosa]KAI4639801.1 hypothetical protein J4E93_009155 [Alternaria ventricosa]